MYDVAVVGAGPAGAAAAIAAARGGASVLLLDRHDFPRDKACGDGIAPHVFDFLRTLGVTDVEDGYPGIDHLSVTAPSGGLARRPMRRPARVIPRYVFDARLVQAAIAAGAELRRHTVRRLWTLPDRVVVDGIEARTLIGADGATSMVRRHLGHAPNPAGHLAVAIRGYLPQPAVDRLEQRIVMCRRGWPAYAWSFPIGDGRRNVGYGEVLRGRPLSRAYLLERLAALLADTGGLDAATGLRAHHLPLSTRRPSPGSGRVLLAGDALSLINPFTGEGIFYAVVSGALAGAAAARGDGHTAAQRYAHALRLRLHRHLRHTSIAARLARYPSIVNGGLKVGAGDQRVFDAFVELGLGDGLLTARLLSRTIAGILAPAKESVPRHGAAPPCD